MSNFVQKMSCKKGII